MPSWSEEDLARKLAPESAIPTLVRASALLTGWELIRSTVLGHVKDFFIEGFDQTGYLYSDSYRTNVLSLAPRPFDSSVIWLVNAGALTNQQAAVLTDIRAHRNEVVHELASYVVDPDKELKTDLLLRSRECLKALARFWGAIEADSNPDFDDRDVDYNGIESGFSLLFDYLLGMAGLLSDEGEETAGSPRTS